MGCKTADYTTCGAMLWAPEIHYLPSKAADVPGSGGYFLAFSAGMCGGGAGVLKSTTGTAFGPYAGLNHQVPGLDMSLFQDPKTNDVYGISVGPGIGDCAGIFASRLSQNMSVVDLDNSFCLSKTRCAEDCSHTGIGFEGPFVVAEAGKYFLSASGFGNGTFWTANPSTGKGIKYQAYMGVATTFRGPYTNGRNETGSWLAVENGGHNSYFRSPEDGALYSTLWYGSDPGNNTPEKYAGIVDLPSIVKCEVVEGRLVAEGTPSSPHEVTSQGESRASLQYIV